MNITPEAILGTLSGLIGVFVGAFLTWKLQRSEAEKQLHRQRIQAFRKCMVAVASQRNMLLNLWAQFLNEHSTDDDRHLKIKTIGDYSNHRLVDIESMSFLIDLNEPQLFIELDLHNGKYEMVRGGIQFRNHCMEQLMAVAKPVSSQETGKIEFDVPVEQNFRLLEVTNNLYESFHDAHKSSQRMFSELGVALYRYDPKARPIKAEFPSLEVYVDKFKQESNTDRA